MHSTTFGQTHGPVHDPLGAAPRIGLLLVFALMALVIVVRLAQVA